MEKFQSIADFLGLHDNDSLAPEGASGSTSGASPMPRLEDITDSKAFALAVLNSREFRQFIVNGVTLGDLPTPLVLRLMDHAWGKPVERVEVRDTTNDAESLTAEQLEDRALRLAEMARSIRLAPMPKDGAKDKESVH